MLEFISLGRSDTPIGSIKVTATGAGLTQVDLAGFQPLIGLTPNNEKSTSQAWDIATQTLQEILDYLSGKRSSFNVKIDWSKISPFQRSVLEITHTIPFGEIRTYGQIAKAIKNINANRAIGGALGRNPMPIIIPCHRVIAANGYLTGFSAADGIRTKQWLLELEGHKIEHEKLA